jgi:hypothetical protein
VISPESHDIIERAELLYNERLKADLERTHLNFFVAIEPDSGDYFLGHTLSEASAAARKAHPERRAYIIRIGHRAAVEFGGASFTLLGAVDDPLTRPAAAS